MATINGTSGNDSLPGSNDADTLLGLAGNDTLSGLGGNDSLNGGDGDDSLIGGDGADTLAGGEGNDTVQGEAGSDVFNDTGGNDSLLGGEGNDVFFAGAGNDTLDGSNDAATFAGTPINSVAYSLAPAAVSVDLSAPEGTAQDGFGGVDRLLNIQRVIGSNLADTLRGSTRLHTEVFDGRGGDDTIDGGALADPLGRDTNRVEYSAVTGTGVELDLRDGTTAGGAGVDRLLNINAVLGSPLADTLRGSDSEAVVEEFAGGAGNDSIDGRGGVDLLRYDLTLTTTGVLVDLATGSAVDGHSGVDSFGNIEGVWGSRHADQLLGSNRPETEFFAGLGGNDTIDGRGGHDVADYARAAAGIVVTLGDSGSDRGVGSAVNVADGGGDTDQLRGIEAVIGTAFADHFIGGAGGQTFEGGAGNDTIDGGPGSQDEASYEHTTKGRVTALLDDGSALVEDGFGNNDTDTLLGIEHLTGSRLFGDLLRGDGGNNRLRGLGGDDTLAGLGGRDTLDGGDGNDRLEVGNQRATIDGGAGDDRLYVFSDLFNFSLSLIAPDRLLLTRGTTTRLEVTRVEEIDFDDNTVSWATLIQGLSAPGPTAGDDEVYGSHDDDAIDGLAGGDYIEGGEGNDTLQGNAGVDGLYGGPGDDQITGGPDDDDLYGDDGNDLINGTGPFGGAEGDDRLTGGLGNDTLFATGRDTLRGGPGDDRFQGDSAIVSYAADESAGAGIVVRLATFAEGVGFAQDGYGGVDAIDVGRAAIVGSPFADDIQGRSHAPVQGPASPHDDIDGHEGDDTLAGLLGDDTLSGDDGDDRLTGGPGYDALFGGAGNDVLAGEDQDDTLFPGGGNNTLNGGNGFDAVDYGDEPAGVGVNLGELRGTTSSGVDTLTAIEAVLGSAFADDITGDSGANRAVGRGGNDSFRASDGIDLLDYDDYTLPEGAGVVVVLPSDSLGGGNAQDGHGGTDTIFLGAAEQLRGSRGADALTGALFSVQGSDTIGHDTIWGADGNDTLNGLSGNDSLDGGNGDDRLLPGEGQDTVLGGAGNDVLVLGFARSAYTPSLTGTGLLLSRSAGQSVQLQGVETVQFSDGTFTVAQLAANAGATLVGTWRFADTLAAEQPTVPALVAIDPQQRNRFETALVHGVPQRVYSWDGSAELPTLNGGFSLDTTNLVPANSWSVELVFRFAAGSDDDWRRIVDTQNRQSDNGLYLDPFNELNVFPDVSGSRVLTSGVFHSVVLSNLVVEGTQQVAVYLDGELQMQSQTDQLNLDNASNPGRLLHFFVDNLVNGPDDEWAAGSIASLKLYSGILVPEPPAGQTLAGSAGNDTLDGANGADSLSGLGGDDRLTGGPGNDSLAGGDGADVLAPGAGRDLVDGGSGTDLVSYADLGLAVVVNIGLGSATTTTGEQDTLVGIEGAIGGALADRFVGDSGSNSFQGRAGNDTFDGSPGIDTLDYRDATLAPGVGVTVTLPASSLAPGSASDGHGGSDEIHLGAAEQVQGSDGPDSITGAPFSQPGTDRIGDDSLWGNGGNDTLAGLSGDDQLAGGAGDDVLRPGAGRDTAIGGEGDDLVELALPRSSYTVARSGTDLLISAGSSEQVLISGVERVRFSDGTQTLAQLEAALGQTVTGTAGNDTLQGGPGADLLRGLDGDDVLIDGPGDDRLDGGEESDRYDVDVLVFTGNTPVVVNLAAGTATRGSEQNTLANFEAVFGSSGADNLRGADGSADSQRGETLRGGAGDDTLDGGLGVDAAEFLGNRADYTVTRLNATTITVRDNNLANGDEGTDRLLNIERIVFADEMLSFGTRAEELARVAFALWTPAVVTSTTLFSRGYSFYDNGGVPDAYSFTVMCVAALNFWTADSDTQLAQRLITNSGSTKTVADLLQVMATAGGGVFGRAAALADVALSAGMTQRIEASNIATVGVVSVNFVPDFGQLFDLLPPAPPG